MADDFNSDYQAGKGGQTHYQPTNYANYQRGVDDRQGVNKNPLRGWSGGGGGGAGVGILILPALLFGAFFYLLIGVMYAVPFIIVAFAFAAIFYPTAGAIAVLTGILIRELFIANDVPSVQIAWIVLLPYIVALVLAVPKVERRVKKGDRYRRIRHWIGVIGFGVASTEVALQLLAPFVVGHNLAWGMEIYLVRG